MMLADMGADVIRVERPGTGDVWTRSSVLDRGRQRVVLDLKSDAGVDAVLTLVQHADVLIEGLRPGVAERLGVGPADCLARNARLVFGRVTGWGQTGPYAHTAGHDITYLATTGALHAIGREGERPVPPVNLVGDFGGGGMLLAFGVLCAVIHARETGRGQVVDAAIVDGAISLTSMLHGLMASGNWQDARGVNLFDGGAPFYDTYECADGRYVAVGALEAKFFTTLANRVGLADDPAFSGDHLDRARWPAIRSRLTETFLTRTRDEWSALLRDSDACVAPVLSLREAAADEANVARGAFRRVGDELQPAPAPRFSGTPPVAGGTPSGPG
jgi:alpha-methylacyl-CoA racemase